MSDLLPIRCFTCAKVVGNMWEKYIDLLTKGYTEAEALDHLGLKRYCCRRMLISHVTAPESIGKCAPVRP